MIPKKQPRKNWAKRFREQHHNGDDHLLIDDVFSDETFDDVPWSTESGEK